MLRSVSLRVSCRRGCDKPHNEESVLTADWRVQRVLALRVHEPDMNAIVARRRVHLAVQPESRVGPTKATGPHQVAVVETPRLA